MAVLTIGHFTCLAVISRMRGELIISETTPLLAHAPGSVMLEAGEGKDVHVLDLFPVSSFHFARTFEVFSGEK